MARRVPVSLELIAAQYLAEARRVQAATSAVDRDMDALDRSIEKVEREMAELSAAATVAGKRVDNLGDQARGAAGSMTALDARIKATRLSVRELGLEFARTGDKIDGQNLAKEQALLNRLERLKKTLGSIAPDGSVIPNLSSGASSGVSGLGRMSASNPVVIGAIGGLATATALGLPTLGAMIAGLVAGGIGTGGVIGGVAMAAKDPGLQNAAADFVDVISKEFFAGGDAFVEPAIHSLKILEDGFKNLDLGDSFAKVAPSVEIIAHGIEALARNAMPGLDLAFGRMTPFANAAAEGMAEMGGALGDFVDSVTASPGAVMGLEAAFNLINNTIRVTGGFLEWLSNGFEDMVHSFHALAIAILAMPGIPGFVRDGAEGLLHAMEDLETHGRTWQHSMEDGTHATEVFGQAVDKATRYNEIFADALSDSYSAFLDFTGAAISAEAAVDDVADALLKNGLNFDIDTEAGRENVRGLKDLAEAAAEATKKKLIETGSVEDANKVYDEYRQKLYDAAIQAGATAEQAQALVDKWLALQNLQNIEKFVTIYQHTIRFTTGPDPNVTWGGGFQEFADGGVVQGPSGSAQMVVAHAGEVVLNKQQQAQQWNNNGSNYGGGTMRHVVDLQLNGRTIRELAISDALDRNIQQTEIRLAYP